MSVQRRCWSDGRWQFDILKVLFGNIRASDGVLECYRHMLAIKIKIEHQIISIVVLISSQCKNVENIQYLVQILEQKNRIQLHASFCIHDQENSCWSGTYRSMELIEFE